MSAAAVDAANAAPLSGSKEMSLEEPKKMTREDWRKKKELEEQRKYWHLMDSAQRYC